MRQIIRARPRGDAIAGARVRRKALRAGAMAASAAAPELAHLGKQAVRGRLRRADCDPADPMLRQVLCCACVLPLPRLPSRGKMPAALVYAGAIPSSSLERWVCPCNPSQRTTITISIGR